MIYIYCHSVPQDDCSCAGLIKRIIASCFTQALLQMATVFMSSLGRFVKMLTRQSLFNASKQATAAAARGTPPARRGVASFSDSHRLGTVIFVPTWQLLAVLNPLFAMGKLADGTLSTTTSRQPRVRGISPAVYFFDVRKHVYVYLDAMGFVP